jgi:hypothetical protein
MQIKRDQILPFAVYRGDNENFVLVDGGRRSEADRVQKPVE